MTCSEYEKQIVVAKKAPKAIGPYSAGVTTGCMVFTAGQLGIDPENGNLIDGGIQEQTRQALTNLQAVLEAAGTNLGLVVKTTVFLKDIREFGQMNEIYGTFFTENYPARSSIQVAALPLNAAVEIEAVALLPENG